MSLSLRLAARRSRLLRYVPVLLPSVDEPTKAHRSARDARIDVHEDQGAFCAHTDALDAGIEAYIVHQYGQSKPLKGARIAGCLHM